ncbi:LysR family transcriptional regulator [Paraglaciecola aquimarina]|uniref:LysR family transcriptional regulator n=1 Tax=Paraglaciecola aquimarina TaxID=1235557 RepID=A0ABU3SXZ6_9ALTE|nr:LysR family transcriptional regulator [Paraglaciecola aquimarina]MDU0354881.1 LysR family transcriptional regulator [Paraglaciecola aquimarina]
MQANDLILFSQVIELGSFSKVADANNLTNSVVSKRIARLEQDLGVQLLYRTTRKLTLTEAGTILLHRAKMVQQATTEALDALSGFGENISGHIRMSVPTISGELLLADLVAKFCQAYPQISIELRLENDLIDLVENGIDLAIRTAKLADSSLIATKIIDSSWVVCASPEYLCQSSELAKLDDLKRHNCLRYDLQSEGSSDWRFTQQQNTFSVAVSGSLSSNNALSLKKAALNNSGIIYVPKCSVHEELLSGKLQRVLPDFTPRELGVYAVYPYTRHQPLKIKLLIEEIRQAYHGLSHYFRL